MKWRETADRTLALVGVMVAICAAVITFYQVHLMHSQAKIAVWPNLQQYDTNTVQPGIIPPPGTAPIYARVLFNSGLGPAVIRYFGISYRGRELHGWKPVFRDLLGQNGRHVHRFDSQSDLPPGTVIPQGQKEAFIVIRSDLAPAAEARAGLVVTRICYCSVYGTCWLSSSDTTINQRVRHCPNAKTSGFYAGGNALAEPAATGAE